MPATSPRFSITVAPETFSALKRLATVQDRPVASLIREYLESVTPTFNDMADVMEKLKVAQASAKAELASSLGEVEEELRPHMEGILGHLSALASIARSAVTEEDEREGGECRAASRSASSRTRQPPLCNTGVVND